MQIVHIFYYTRAPVNHFLYCAVLLSLEKCFLNLIFICLEIFSFGLNFFFVCQCKIARLQTLFLNKQKMVYFLFCVWSKPGLQKKVQSRASNYSSFSLFLSLSFTGSIFIKKTTFKLTASNQYLLFFSCFLKFLRLNFKVFTKLKN